MADWYVCPDSSSPEGGADGSPGRQPRSARIEPGNPRRPTSSFRSSRRTAPAPIHRSAKTCSFSQTRPATLRAPWPGRPSTPGGRAANAGWPNQGAEQAQRGRACLARLSGCGVEATSNFDRSARRRPDVALPAPADIATLASRVGVRSSVQRAVDALDAVHVAHSRGAGVLLPERAVPVPTRSSGCCLPRPREQVVAARWTSYRTLALVWGGDDGCTWWQACRTRWVRTPAGLGRPAARLLGGGVGPRARPRATHARTATRDPTLAPPRRWPGC